MILISAGLALISFGFALTLGSAVKLMKADPWCDSVGVLVVLSARVGVGLMFAGTALAVPGFFQ